MMGVTVDSHFEYRNFEPSATATFMRCVRGVVGRCVGVFDASVTLRSTCPGSAGPWSASVAMSCRISGRLSATSSPSPSRAPLPFNLDPPICLMARTAPGYECERGARAGGSVPVSHRSLPHKCCLRSPPDLAASCSNRSGSVRTTLSLVGSALLARVVRTPSPTARLWAGAG